MAPVDTFMLKPVIVLKLMDPFDEYMNCPEASITKYPVPAFTAKGAPFTVVKAPLFASTLKAETVLSLPFSAYRKLPSGATKRIGMPLPVANGEAEVTVSAPVEGLILNAVYKRIAAVQKSAGWVYRKTKDLTIDRRQKWGSGDWSKCSADGINRKHRGGDLSSITARVKELARRIHNRSA